MDLILNIKNQAKKEIKSIVLPEGTEERIIRAAEQLKNENLVEPIILGDPKQIQEKAQEIQISLDGIQIIHPQNYDQFESFVDFYHELRKHKGISREIATRMIQNPLFFGAMLLRHGIASGAVAGSINTTGDVLRAAIQIVGLRPNIEVVSSCFFMVLPNNRILTFADCAVIPDPSAEQLASIAISSASTHRKLIQTEPKIAMLSFSTKGSAKHPLADKVIEATEKIKNIDQGLIVDGELQFDAAYVPDVGKKKAPQSPVAGEANVYIFPDLNSANIGYKMVQRLAGAMAIGPIIQGLAKPYNDLSRGCTVEDIVNVSAICSILSGDS
jgi:phosphate acetyltransferase